MPPEVKDSVPTLTQLLKDTDADVRSFAAQGLGRKGPAAKEAIPTLMELLKDEDANVRSAAGNALTEISARHTGNQ